MRNAGLLAVAVLLAATGRDIPMHAQSRRPERRINLSPGTELEREIAEHNAAVERRKAEKMAVKRARTAVIARMRGEGK